MPAPPRAAGNHAVAGVLQRQGITQEESYVAGNGGLPKSLTPHGDVQTETHAATTYVRVYQTVYAAVAAGSGSRWKDVHQKPGGQIEIKGQGEMWLNAGRPWRALHYVRTYLAQSPGKRDKELEEARAKATLSDARRDEITHKHGRPVVRSFLLRYATYLELTSSAIAENQVGDYGAHNLSVDKTKDSDQFLIRENEVAKIEAMGKPNSLVSYVLDDRVADYQGQAHHGNVKPLSELLEALGMPLDLLSDDGLALPLVNNEMAADAEQIAHAEKLHKLYQLSFELEKAAADGQKLADLAFLSRELLGTQVWPAQAVRRAARRERIANAATYALMPSIMRENYEEAEARMGGRDTLPGGKAISPWMKRQTFRKVPIAKTAELIAKEERAAKEARDRAAKYERELAEKKARGEVDAEEEESFGFDLFSG